MDKNPGNGPTTAKPPVKNEAVRWVIRINAGELSAREAMALQRWLDQSDAHYRAFRQHAQAWLDAGRLLEQPSVRPNPSIGWPSAFRRLVRRGRWRWSAVAASVVLILAAGLLYPLRESTPVEESVAQTAIGESFRLAFSDGSVVQLNTDTEIESHYSAHTRVVKMIKGEAHFEVAPEADRPFRVYAGLNVIEALGTAFRVGMTGPTEVTVTEGQVRLMSLREAAESLSEWLSEPPLAVALPNEVLLVHAGQNAVFRKDRIVVETIDESTMRKRLSWRGGMLLFDGDSLATVAREFERYTQTDIVVDDDIKDTRIVGYFSVGDMDEFLVALDESFNIASQTTEQGSVRLSPRDEAVRGDGFSSQPR